MDPSLSQMNLNLLRLTWFTLDTLSLSLGVNGRLFPTLSFLIESKGVQSKELGYVR